MNRAWVFDLDDTLYLERDYVRSGFHAVDNWASNQLGVSGVYGAAWDLFVSGVRGTTLTDAFDAVGRPLTNDETIQVVEVYRDHIPNIRLCPDSSLLLNQLSPSGDMVAIVTDGPAISQRAKLRALKLHARDYHLVVTGEHGPTWHKPSTIPFKHVQSRFGIQSRYCTYIADNPHKDFCGPKSLGWRTVRIIRPLGLHSLSESEPGEVDRTVDSLIDLPDQLEPQ